MLEHLKRPALVAGVIIALVGVAFVATVFSTAEFH